MTKEPTDYDQFTAAAKEWGCTLRGEIGALCSKKAVRLEEWELPKSGGFILMAHKKTGKIGVYALVGKNGLPVVNDLQWLREKCR